MTVCLLPQTVLVQTKTPMPDGNQTAMVELCSAWAGAWNRHDAHALSLLCGSDIDFVTVAGLWLRGIGEFRNHHAEIHRLQMRESIWTNIAHATSLLSDNIALIHLQWAIAGDRDPDGAPGAPRQGLFTWVIARRSEEWRIVAAHNSNLRQEVRQRLL